MKEELAKKLNEQRQTILELKSKIEKLENQAGELKLELIERRGIYSQPSYEDESFFLSGHNEINDAHNYDWATYNECYNIYTGKMAQREEARRAVEIKLLSLAQEWEKAHPIDWSDKCQPKHYPVFCWNHITKEADMDVHSKYINEEPCRIYFQGHWSEVCELLTDNLTTDEITAYAQPRRFM